MEIMSVHLLKMRQETGKCFQEILRVGINSERMSKTYKINVCINNKTIDGFGFRVFLRIIPDRRGCYLSPILQNTQRVTCFLICCIC